MKKLMVLAAALALLSTPAFAEDAAPATEAPAAEAPAAEAPAAEVKMLKDGTKVEIAGDAVSVVAADGTKTPAPDGEHELEDGTKIKVMGGKIVHE